MDATIAAGRWLSLHVYAAVPGPSRLLIEDTRYSDTPTLDRDAMRAAIPRVCRSTGLADSAGVREEEGALPVVLGGDLEAFWAALPGVPRSGIRAGLFHYTTGYSLPEAVRLADDIAGLPDSLTSAELAQWVRARSFRLWRRGRFFRLLNRMLFWPASREATLRHAGIFLSTAGGSRRPLLFGCVDAGDKLRIVSGIPRFRSVRLGSLFLYRAAAEGPRAQPPGG